jgi:hypothetical protein
MGATGSICCRDHQNISRISAISGFCTYVDWDFFAHLSTIPLSSLCPILTPCITLILKLPYSVTSRVRDEDPNLKTENKIISFLVKAIATNFVKSSLAKSQDSSIFNFYIDIVITP